MVDADLSKYFDSIPHGDLLKSVARRVADGAVLRLIKLWLKAPIEERGGDGTPRMSGGKGNTRGTPQGGASNDMIPNLQNPENPLPYDPIKVGKTIGVGGG